MTDVNERYGVDELAAVAQLLSVPAFPGTDGTLGALAADAQDAALRSARRSLLARRVLEIDEAGVLSVAAPHSVLFRVALAPLLVVTAERRLRDGIESRSFYLRPEVAVEHSVDIGRVHELAQFEPGELLARLGDFSGLDASRPAGDGAFEAGAEVLDEALRGGSPALPPEAETFAEALSPNAGLSRVTALHRDGTRVVGGELTWIDAGALWLVEPVSDGNMAVRGVTAGELIGELLSYLPGAGRTGE